MGKKLVMLRGALLLIVFCIFLSGCRNRIEIGWKKVENQKPNTKPIDLRVFVENSGSMDAYMCLGSTLKDAVFDYVSDLSRFSRRSSLFYINSKEIPYKGNLQSFIKDLTPQQFTKAGGDRTNTDLRQIFQMMLNGQKNNTVTVFVSDCILDISQSPAEYFGNCEVSLKNTFNNALTKNPNLGVEIIKLESTFNGYWYCGNNSELLLNVKRPYYIWVIGNKDRLAFLNKEVPVKDIIGGIKDYCAFAGKQQIPFDIDKKEYPIGHDDKIRIPVLVNLSNSLQSDKIINSVGRYRSSNPSQTSILSVEKITDTSNKYSHVINIAISNPKTIKKEVITFSYPYIASWVEESNDETGKDVKRNMDKTTGILYLIKGVAQAYKSATDYGTISFNLK